MLEMFIKSITFDDEKRIVVKVQDHLKEYMTKEEYKKQVKETLEKVLGQDFIKLEVAPSSARITVAEGKEESAKAKIEQELKDAIQMAMQMMQQMNNKNNKNQDQ